MRFGVFGPLAVWTDHGEPVTVPGRKVRALLAVLLVHEGRVVSADQLVEDLWGETPPADPTAALHVRVSQLRRALAGAEEGGKDLVVSQAPGYALRASTDAAQFADLVERARTTGDPRGLLAEALDLWRGPALADFADEEFARTAIARWEELRLATVEEYAEARLATGEHRELAGELSEHVTRHPFRERLRAAHMRALHRSGRTSEALDSFGELRRRLADELGLDPGSEVTSLHNAILAGDPAEDAPATRPTRATTNLPAPVAELIGREHSVAHVRELLAAGRLVTLTGPGGVGKTSVAVAVGRALAGSYQDGVWLVDLTTWDSSGDAAEPVLSVLSVPDTADGPAPERLASALRERRAVLILDNCEHVVVPVAGLVAVLLAAAPDLRVLATSREPLRLRGEARFDLPPLDVPETDDPERLRRSPAVRLFMARAGLPENQATVASAAEVCRRLDGIPLALELAAGRVPALGVAELAARLRIPHDRFGLLGTGPRDAPTRQRTLAAVIDWSWRLLTDAERTVLRRLAVHSGGATLADAEAVCGGDGVLDLLAGLVDRSLVVRNAASRFGLLESVAAYCTDRLREAGEETVLRRRHADHYLAVAEQAEPLLRGPGQREWLGRLDAEAANLRAALDTFVRTGAAEQALRLAVALVWYWFLRGRLTEAMRALTGALAVPGEAPDAIRASAEAWHAGLAIRLGQAGPERVAEVLGWYHPERAAGIWTDEHGDPRARNEPRGLRAQEGRRRVEARERRAEARQSDTERAAYEDNSQPPRHRHSRGLRDEPARCDLSSIWTDEHANPRATTEPRDLHAQEERHRDQAHEAPSGARQSNPERAAGVWTDEHGDPCARNEPRGLRAQEGRRRTEAREAPSGARQLNTARAEWFLAASIIDFGDEKATVDLLTRALDTFRSVGDRWGEAAVLSTRAMLAHMRYDLAALEHDARRGAELFGELGDDWGVLAATDWLIGLADLTGDHAEAVRLSRESLRTAEELGLWSDAAGQLGWLAWLSVQVEDYPRAKEYAEQALRLATEQGRAGEVFVTLSLAYATRRSGELDAAEKHLRWLLRAAREQQTGEGNPPYLPMVLTELGLLAEQRGDAARALVRHQEAFDLTGSPSALVGMAAALVLDGRAGIAARLLGAAESARKDGPRSATERTELARVMAAVEAAEPDFAALFAQGAELTPEQARSLLDGTGPRA